MVGAVLVASCSSDGDGADPSSTSTSDTGSAPASSTTSEIDASTTTTAGTAVEPAIDLSAVTVEPVPAGGGESSPPAGSTAEMGYTQTEYVVSGMAATYSGPATGPAEPSEDPSPYRTRILVRLPSDPAAFSGRVLVEPFNNSGVVDADVVWPQVDELLAENGDGWVGVTHRVSAIGPLTDFDPDRYGDLELTTNAHAWDIISHVGALLLAGDRDGPAPGLEFEHLYLTGFSQNGIDVATYLSSFNDTVRRSDGSPLWSGYLPMGRSGSMTPLDSGTAPLPMFEHRSTGPADAPVVEVNTQTDVEGFIDGYTSPSGAAVRRPDSDDPDDPYRLYEITGAPHVPSLGGCEGGGSTFPTSAFIRAAYANLVAWAEEGITPPSAEPIDSAEIDIVSPSRTDEYGNALGGVRSPWVDVPVSTFVAHADEGPLCELAGVETPLPADVLTELYPSPQDYLDAFTESLDTTIEAGFLLEGERAELLADGEARAEELPVG